MTMGVELALQSINSQSVEGRPVRARRRDHSRWLGSDIAELSIEEFERQRPISRRCEAGTI